MAWTPEELNQLPSIRLQSPLAILGALLYLVRHRFDPEFKLPWEWSGNATETGILVETQFNEGTEVRDNRPGIFIDRSQTTYGKVSLRNLDQDQGQLLPKETVNYISIGQTDVTIDCISTSRGESAQLADEVQSYLESSKYIIMGVFKFRDISPIVMGPTQAFEKQTELHQTNLTFRVEYETKWRTSHAFPILRGLGLRIADQDPKTGVNTIMTDIYLNSSR